MAEREAKNPIAKKLKLIRASGVTYEEMCVHAKICWNTMKNIFSNKNISYRTLMHLCDAGLISEKERLSYVKFIEKRGKDEPAPNQ